MTPEDVKKHYKSAYNFHKITKMSPNTLLNWVRWGFVPLKAQLKLEGITRGKLKAMWHRNELDKEE